MLLKAPRCGACIKNDSKATTHSGQPLRTRDQNLPPATPDPDPSTKSIERVQADARRAAMLARTLHKGSQKSGSSVPVGTAKGVPRQISVYLAPATSAARTDASRMLSNATRSFPEDVLMDVIGTWTGTKSLGTVLLHHIALRLLGNVGVEPHSTLGTLGHFFDVHDRIHGNHPKKMLQGPPTLKLRSPAIYLEIIFHTHGFISEIRKRKLSTASSNVTSVVKRTRSQLTTDSFAPLRSEIGELPDLSKVSFLFATISVARDGSVDITFPDLAATPSVCILQDSPLGQGKTKNVYKVIYEGMPWVAKRFKDIGAGEGQVEIAENTAHLMEEVTRLGKTDIYLKGFVAEANDRGTAVIPPPHLESSLDQYQAACNTTADSESGVSAVKILWLFEPRRTTKVEHWSGTNECPAWPQKKLGSTLNAFTHYVYQISQETTVLADLQTSAAVNENGDGLNVRFDVMMHTTNGASGVGDHGQEGIDHFVDSHECVERCAGLKLSREGFKKGLELGDGSDDEEDQ
ncbi:kinase-like domain-containing protein [Favolaschia claudopus]|uniref:Kinase-like domain-containing protein n=1 Tax=Favolaschia claudopus TaxID=2862362 RepID=A0AAW0C8F9_9AGAR